MHSILVLIVVAVTVAMAAPPVPDGVLAYNEAKLRECDAKRDRMVNDIMDAIWARAKAGETGTEAWLDADLLDCGPENRVLVREIAERLCGPERHLHMTCDTETLEQREMPLAFSNGTVVKDAFRIVVKSRPLDDTEPCECPPVKKAGGQKKKK